MAHAYKAYSTAPQLRLPRLWDKDDHSSRIEAVIERRRTSRQFTSRSVSIVEISKLLHFSYGITGAAPISQSSAEEEFQYFRAAPSAGGLYPLELYLVLWRVTYLEPGIYHYSVVSHALERLKTGDFSQLAGEYTFAPEIAEKACVLLIISAMFERTFFKYNERGYRFVWLDAGHLAQNVCLVATALRLGVVPMGGFLDDELNRLIDIDGVHESVIYPLFVGTL